jgi:malonate transporter MadL subunit
VFHFGSYVYRKKNGNTKNIRAVYRPSAGWFTALGEAEIPVSQYSLGCLSDRIGGHLMVIFGTALLASCYLAGVFIGEAIAAVIGVKANVGGVGIAMLLLIGTQHFLRKRGLFTLDTERGVTFWAMMYIPVVVAMASTQNVIVAAKSGRVALLGAAAAFAACVIFIALINRLIERANAANVPRGTPESVPASADANLSTGAS